MIRQIDNQENIQLCRYMRGIRREVDRGREIDRKIQCERDGKN